MHRRGDLGPGALVHPEPMGRRRLAVEGEREPEGRAGVVVPDFHGIDPVPGGDLPRPQQVVDGGQGTAAAAFG